MDCKCNTNLFGAFHFCTDATTIVLETTSPNAFPLVKLSRSKLDSCLSEQADGQVIMSNAQIVRGSRSPFTWQPNTSKVIIQDVTGNKKNLESLSWRTKIFIKNQAHDFQLG